MLYQQGNQKKKKNANKAASQEMEEDDQYDDDKFFEQRLVEHAKSQKQEMSPLRAGSLRRGTRLESYFQEHGSAGMRSSIVMKRPQLNFSQPDYDPMSNGSMLTKGTAAI